MLISMVREDGGRQGLMLDAPLNEMSLEVPQLAYIDSPISALCIWSSFIHSLLISIKPIR